MATGGVYISFDGLIFLPIDLSYTVPTKLPKSLVLEPTFLATRGMLSF
jgi:hypothetical protein